MYSASAASDGNEGLWRGAWATVSGSWGCWALRHSSCEFVEILGHGARNQARYVLSSWQKLKKNPPKCMLKAVQCVAGWGMCVCVLGGGGGGGYMLARSQLATYAIEQLFGLITSVECHILFGNSL